MATEILNFPLLCITRIMAKEATRSYSHVQFTYKCILPLFAYDGCIRAAYQILVNLTSSGSQQLGGVPTKLYLSVSTITVPSWKCGFLSWRVECVS